MLGFATRTLCPSCACRKAMPATGEAHAQQTVESGAVVLHPSGSLGWRSMMRFEGTSFLLIAEALRRQSTSYGEFLACLPIAPDTLDGCLEGLVGSGLLKRLPGPTPLRESGFELSAKGLDLAESITSLEAWSARWAVEGSRPEKENIEISLLGSFGVSVGGRPIRGLSLGSQRLLALLALNDRAVARTTLAGTMWPDSSEARAGVSLRSALSRMDTETRGAITAASAALELADHVVVDLWVARELAGRIVDTGSDLSAEDVGLLAVETLSHDVLPDWYDEWMTHDSEDWRQLRVNALEALALLMIADGRLADGAAAARAAIKVEPLRESAHAALIAVHLAEGNQAEALRVFDRFSAVLQSALDLAPTQNLAELVAGIHRV